MSGDANEPQDSPPKAEEERGAALKARREEAQAVRDRFMAKTQLGKITFSYWTTVCMVVAGFFLGLTLMNLMHVMKPQARDRIQTLTDQLSAITQGVQAVLKENKAQMKQQAQFLLASYESLVKTVQSAMDSPGITAVQKVQLQTLLSDGRKREGQFREFLKKLDAPTQPSAGVK